MTMLSREERELILNGYKTPRNTQMRVEVEALCRHADEADKVIAGLAEALERLLNPKRYLYIEDNSERKPEGKMDVVALAEDRLFAQAALSAAAGRKA